MKALYININGMAIKSDHNIEVIGSAEDSIVESFYISLGEAIAEGVTGIKYKPLVADFANAKPNEFKTFSDQWQEVKALLLGENPSGDYEFTLSSEYLDWLKMNATYSTIYYKKYQNQHQAKVKLNLDELYEDTVDAIRRKVIRFLQTDDNYKNFNEFVVNDDAVTRRSVLVRSVKSKFEEIAFVLYEKWEKSQDVCPYCGKNPCECKLEPPVCSKCGKYPCECEKTKSLNKKKTKTEKSANLQALFPAHNIVLGKTNIQEIAVSGRINKTDAGYRYEINQYAHTTYVIQKYEDDFISLMHIDSFRTQMFPDHWKFLLGFSFKSTQEKCLKTLKGKGFCLIETSDEWVWNAITPDKRFIFTFRFDFDGLDELEVLPYQCPYCGSKDVEISNSDYEEVALYCSNCNNEWGAVDSDRSRAKDLDGLNNIENEYEFDEDNYDYDDNLHTYDDKPGRTAQNIYEELLGLTGDDYHLGDTLIDLGIDENLLNEILIRCKQKLSVTIINELDVYKSDISDLIRLVQKYYYIKN